MRGGEDWEEEVTEKVQEGRQAQTLNTVVPGRVYY